MGAEGMDIDQIVPARVECREPSHEAMHFATLRDQELSRYEPSWPVIPVMKAFYHRFSLKTKIVL